jgi:hypothetical protein
MASILAHSVHDETALERVFHAFTGLDHLFVLAIVVALVSIVSFSTVAWSKRRRR